MKLIFPYLIKNSHKIIFGILCMILVDVAQLIVPQIIKTAVDTLAADRMDRQVLVQQCLLIAGLGIIMAILRYVWRLMLMGSARDLEKGIRASLFSHVMELDLNFFDKTKTGDIMAHATSDINHVRMAFGFGLIAIVDATLLGGATIIIMVWTDPKLTALALIPMPFLIYSTRHLGKKMHSLHKTAQESFSILTELVRESFFGIRVIKVFNFENTIQKKVEYASIDYFSKNLKRIFVTALFRPLIGFFFNSSSLIILFYGGYLVMEHRLTPGELVAFLQYLGILAWPVMAIGWMTNLFQRGMASLNRINGLLNVSPQVTSPDSPVSPPEHLHQIRFDNAMFSYDKKEPVLSGVDIKIAASQRVGITGPPGSGKTTLMRMLPRLYDLDSGRVLINDTPVTALDPIQLRDHMALMPQEPFLFSTTIRDNILMGRSVGKQQLERIIHACDLERTIETMPERLDTAVGERGVTLSGGQKQRLALARTLIIEKKIFILDDPVSQLDTRTAKRVMSRIFNIYPAATYIIISNKVSVLAPCHMIHIMDQGKISAKGGHEDLIKSSSFYAETFRAQQFEVDDD